MYVILCFLTKNTSLHSDEGPGLERVRVVRPQKRLVYTTRPRGVRTYRAAQETPRMLWPRVRSNSDEGPRLYRNTLKRERPGVIYTDQEIAMARGNAHDSRPVPAKPKVFTRENRGRNMPVSAHIPNNGVYDRRLEANLPSADQWERRPHTPY